MKFKTDICVINNVLKICSPKHNIQLHTHFITTENKQLFRNRQFQERPFRAYFRHLLWAIWIFTGIFTFQKFKFSCCLEGSYLWFALIILKFALFLHTICIPYHSRIWPAFIKCCNLACDVEQHCWTTTTKKL